MADDGLAPGEAVECPSANTAVMRAEALSRKSGCAGALAFSRSGDPATGEFTEAKVIRKFGDVHEDLSALRDPLKLDWVRTEITRMRGQIRAQEREIRMLQRAGVSTSTAELLLSRYFGAARWQNLVDHPIRAIHG